MRRLRVTGSSGFALPTVLIASVVMLAVLATSVAAVTATRSALQAQHYNQLARDAAESGLAMAKACIAAGTTTWANPLRPGGTCAGLAAQCSTPSCYVLRSGDVRSTFSVSTPGVAGDVTTVTISGTLEQTRTSTGAVWRSYNQTIRQKDVTTGGEPAAGIALWSQQIAAGNAHTCATSTNSKLFCWGTNTNGAVGDGTTTHRSVPTAIAQGEIPTGSTIRQVNAGNEFVCAVASDNKAYCWGNNGNGMLGDNSTTQRTSPVAVAQGAMPAGASIRQLSVGTSHSCAVASDNKAYCWGLNANGQLGDGTQTQRTTPVAVAQGAMPVGATIKQIGVGVSHTCAIASDSKTYCWGLNTNGQLGDNTTTQRLTPVAINRGAMSTTMIHVQLAVGGMNSCVIASDSKPYCWGLNSSGQLGDNTTTQRNTPVAVVQGAMPASFTVTQLIGGYTHTCAVANDQKAYCWGANSSGQLGDNSTTQRNLPVAVSQGALPAGLMIRQLALGGYHTCATASDSNLYCWGQNTNGGLGDNSTTGRTTPVAVASTNAASYQYFTQLASGDFYACAIAADSKPYCWGQNSSGQLGDGTSTQRLIATAVSQGAMPAGSMVRQIAAATTHTCVIASDNKPYCWGNNGNGRLGDNTTTTRYTATAVLQGSLPAGLIVRQLALGSAHTCAIASDNKPYCWGSAANGRLGDNNTTTDRLTPYAVSQGNFPTGSMVRQIAAASFHTCAIALADSKPYCWGSNTNGRLGDGTTTQRTTPTSVVQGALPAGLMVQQIAVATSHACVIASDNKAYCWGSNSNGRLGDGTTTQSSVPVAVAQGAMPAGSMVIQIATGSAHTCVIASDFRPYCWGSNTNGRLGDGSTTQSTVPVAVAQGSLPAGLMALQIFVGDAHSCVIASDNYTYCWGNGTYGQLGDNGTTLGRSSPYASVPLVSTTALTSNTYYF